MKTGCRYPTRLSKPHTEQYIHIKEQTPTENIRIMIEDSNKRCRVRSTTADGLSGPSFVLGIKDMDGRWVGVVAIQNVNRIEKLCKITCRLGAIERTGMHSLNYVSNPYKPTTTHGRPFEVTSVGLTAGRKENQRCRDRECNASADKLVTYWSSTDPGCPNRSPFPQIRRRRG